MKRAYAAAFALSLFACSGPPQFGGAGADCTQQSDCFSGLDCVRGTCATSGESDGGPNDVSEPDTAAPDLGPDLTSVDGGGDTTADLGPCDGACADPTPVCDAATDSCVGCLTTTDCDSGVCDPATHTCVRCAANTDCTEVTASVCTANTCGACQTSADCSHLGATTVCDAGTCVECTGTRADTCGGNVCDSRLNTCTTFAPKSAGICEECVSDAHCGEGQLCVPQMYEKDDGTGLAEVGTFCLWERDATVPNAPNGACSTVRPFIDDVLATSLDGAQSNVCSLNVTTCPALAKYQSNCPTVGMNEACGAPGFNDGYCVFFDAAANKCTIQCGGDDDCKAGSTCNASTTPNTCTL